MVDVVAANCPAYLMWDCFSWAVVCTDNVEVCGLFAFGNGGHWDEEHGIGPGVEVPWAKQGVLVVLAKAPSVLQLRASYFHHLTSVGDKCITMLGGVVPKIWQHGCEVSIMDAGLAAVLVLVVVCCI